MIVVGHSRIRALLYTADRNTLKDRCSAAAGLEFQRRAQCRQAGHVNVSGCGRIVRMNLDAHAQRNFVPNTHSSPGPAKIR